ncbi:MAG TPA: bifunctional DNA-formamidopyrimidine glycosylase/DNA-(apurinic or apyrimidinic site) lyase [Candidatus Saccharimonadales bacterium]|jgi:formamidopyrimidine-DNA glycosylase|nr:bifunctional DNA-formamidopyrimidine glycosylase/DNA-(apurinic or apyrimidinic site) lyase [Candidatus Saccharimonadales bacterium]
MPELPEVETIKLGLARLLPGREVASVDYDWDKSFPNAKADVERFLIGAKIVSVERRAKVLLIELSSKYSLVIHLKMTGQLVFRAPNESFGAGHPTESLVGELPDRSTRVILKFTDGSQLFFNDQRKFGWMRLMPTAEVVNLDFFRKVGPEPLAADFNWQALKECLTRRKNSNIKAALLDQSVLAGIGNIYADESLWGAKIHPNTLVKSLSDEQIRTLYEELVFVLKLAIEKGGSTDKNYVSAEGKRGSYLSFARVFRRQGQPCPRCGTIIEKIRVAGRGTHICPYCQRLPNQPPSDNL